MAYGRLCRGTELDRRDKVRQVVAKDKLFNKSLLLSGGSYEISDDLLKSQYDNGVVVLLGQ